MADIVGIFGQSVAPGKRQRSESLVEYLQGLLEKAESGELTGAAIVEQYRDDTVGYALQGYMASYSMLGAVEIVKQHIIHVNMRD